VDKSNPKFELATVKPLDLTEKASSSIGVRRTFYRRATRGFFQNFSKLGEGKNGKICFFHSKLRNNLFC